MKHIVHNQWMREDHLVQLTGLTIVSKRTIARLMVPLRAWWPPVCCPHDGVCTLLGQRTALCAGCCCRPLLPILVDAWRERTSPATDYPLPTRGCADWIRFDAPSALAGRHFTHALASGGGDRSGSEDAHGSSPVRCNACIGAVCDIVPALRALPHETPYHMLNHILAVLATFDHATVLAGIAVDPVARLLFPVTPAEDDHVPLQVIMPAALAKAVPVTPTRTGAGPTRSGPVLTRQSGWGSTCARDIASSHSIGACPTV